MYVALKNAGMSNREIGRRLGVDEASVRRGLISSGFENPSRVHEILMELADLLARR